MTYDANKLISVYIKMRDERDRLTREYEAKVDDIKAQMGLIENELIEICKATGQEGGRTPSGSFTRTVKQRFWTSNWDAMYKLIDRYGAFELLEQRIHQGNMKAFLETNPGGLPEGLNVDSRYAISVRKPTGK